MDKGDRVRTLMIALEIALLIITISIVLPFAPRLALALTATGAMGLLLGYKITRRRD